MFLFLPRKAWVPEKNAPETNSTAANKIPSDQGISINCWISSNVLEYLGQMQIHYELQDLYIAICFWVVMWIKVVEVWMLCHCCSSTRSGELTWGGIYKLLKRGFS